MYVVHQIRPLAFVDRNFRALPVRHNNLWRQTNIMDITNISHEAFIIIIIILMSIYLFNWYEKTVARSNKARSVEYTTEVVNTSLVYLLTEMLPFPATPVGVRWNHRAIY